MTNFIHVSGGDCSTAMALRYPKLTCLIAITGGNKPQALRQINVLQRKGHKVIGIASMQGGYGSYFDYIWRGNKVPFFRGCCHRGKEMHLDRFYTALPGVNTSFIGFTEGEELRAHRLVRDIGSWKRKFNFPMGDWTREMCEKFIKSKGMEPLYDKTGCWFCPKQPNPPKWAIEGIISPEGQAERLKIRQKLEKNRGVEQLV